MGAPRKEGKAEEEEEAPPETSQPLVGAGGQQHRRRPSDASRWALRQLTGACRADERLKPLLKLNFSCGAAEDRFVAHLSQHFDVSEIGLLARCLCVPLVSVRVGIVNKQGHLLCPTNARGNLSLGLLPSSNMHITFAGDDGRAEQLALVSSDIEGSEVTIEEISADNSGRSFLLKFVESKALYYWCAEKSKEQGMELITKMKDLLERRPTLSDLTGISDPRLDAFASHLHAYLLTSSIGEVNSMASLNDFLNTSSPHDQYLQPSATIAKSSRFRSSAANASKTSPVYQASLGPRSTFKDGVSRSSYIRSAVREKLKRRVECQLSSSTVPACTIPSASMPVNPDLTSIACEGSSSENQGTSAPLFLPDTFPSLPLFNPLAVQCPLPEGPAQNSLFKPYYCWCPPCPSSLQYNVNPMHLPVTTLERLPLPPLSSLLSNAQPPPVSAVSAKLDTADFPTLNLPALLHDPLLNLPLPTSSLVPLSASQVPTFTPLMSDSIVHIPVIDVCSAGQAYLVSAGPSISAVPQLPGLVNPLIPASESLVERSARETLMRLIASTPPASSPHLMSMMPAILTDVAESISRFKVNKPGDVHTCDQSFSTSCGSDAIGSGTTATELHLDQEASGGDDVEDSHGNCDLQLPPSKL